MDFQGVLGSVDHRTHGGIGSREQMIVDATYPGAIEISGSEVIAWDQWHVAAIAVGLCLRWVIEGGNPVSADTTQ